MNIGKDYKLGSDALNIILYERKTTQPKDGQPAKDRWLAIGYFARAHEALKFIADHRLRNCDFKDLETIAKRQQEIYGLIESVKGLPQLKTETIKDTKERVAPHLQNPLRKRTSHKRAVRIIKQ